MIVQHASKEVTDTWFARIGGPTLFSDTRRIRVIPDLPREIYASWGVGTLSTFGLFSLKAFYNLVTLGVSERVMNTPTGEGSWRWQNSGGFAVDREGRVQWVHVAEHAGDVCDYEKAAESLMRS